MAKYVCKKYKELGFYVNGEFKKFQNGVYNTTDKKEIAALDTLSDVEVAQEDTKSETPAK
jgi:hypothetical protein